MKLLDSFHGGYVHRRRVGKLSGLLAGLIPPEARVLDVGCGDGLLAHRIAERRPDVVLQGIDVLVRRETRVPVSEFDGASIPFDERSWDVVMMVDVLHHAHDPGGLLREAARVADGAIVIKDHTLDGWLAGPTLRFMDHVGNARHGVALPHQYWPRRKWLEAFEEMGWKVDAWIANLGLYPWPASWVFGRSLHFAARLVPADSPGPTRAAEAQTRRQAAWEEAYSRFETPEEEIRKFKRRLARAGAARWPRDREILEVFCGRGNGLHALHAMGFNRLAGADLSAALLAQFQGPARLHVCDGRRLPFADRSKDVVIVQGGLHHLPRLPEDLELTLSEAKRVLRDGGLFFAVEPWLTPFLAFVHRLSEIGWVRRSAAKIDALAVMIHHERETYEQWLDRPETVKALLKKHFFVERCSTAWGKITFLGRKGR